MLLTPGGHASTWTSLTPCSFDKCIVVDLTCSPTSWHAATSRRLTSSAGSRPARVMGHFQSVAKNKTPLLGSRSRVSAQPQPPSSPAVTPHFRELVRLGQCCNTHRPHKNAGRKKSHRSLIRVLLGQQAVATRASHAAHLALHRMWRCRVTRSLTCKSTIGRREADIAVANGKLPTVPKQPADLYLSRFPFLTLTD